MTAADHQDRKNPPAGRCDSVRIMISPRQAANCILTRAQATRTPEVPGWHERFTAVRRCRHARIPSVRSLPWQRGCTPPPYMATGEEKTSGEFVKTNAHAGGHRIGDHIAAPFGGVLTGASRVAQPPFC